MWERSQVEQLTGLSRHMIQDLCYQDTKRGGLAFWEPAVSKPGYSRFDEGDLLMFFLVGQLKRAGFTLAEVEATVFDILEEDGALTSTLRKKAHALHERRAGLDGQLTALECLEDAAAAEPSERLYAVMASALAQSVDRAIAAAAERTQAAGGSGVADRLAAERLRTRFLCLARALIAALQGVAEGNGASQDSALFATVAREIRDLVADGCDPCCPAARRAVGQLVRYLATDEAAEGAETAGRRLALCVLAAFLGDAGNGVPVELVLGNGSFAFLGKATAACLADFDSDR
ncbi:hypothetical protein [Enorma burkinafasonensis]|uniref:hypothetical protein n=1 Tax=Enorma burkinafasonensis TaxID=2590867 RepID=UPI0026EB6620|nr:hypothetical protein [Enorma burkinafasonensis]